MKTYPDNAAAEATANADSQEESESSDDDDEWSDLPNSGGFGFTPYKLNVDGHLVQLSGN